MSGSTTGTEVNVKIGATAAEFEASCKAAAAAMQSLSGAIDGFVATMKAATGALSQATPAMDGARSASAAVATSFKSTSSETTRAAQSTRDLIDAMTGVSRAEKSAADSAEVFRKALGDTGSATAALRSSFEDINQGAGHAAHGMAGVTREIIVIAHEAVSGNFSRIPGSMMVLSERIGGITFGMLGWAAAIGSVVYATYELVKGWHEVEQAVRAAQGAQVTVGTWTERSPAQFRAALDEAKKFWGLTKSEAVETTQEYQTMGGAAAKYISQITALGNALTALRRADPVDTAKEVTKAFNGGAESARKWAESQHYITAETARSIEAMIAGGHQAEAMGALLRALDVRAGQSGTALADATRRMKETAAVGAAIASAGVAMVNPVEAPTQQALDIGKPGTKADDPEKEDRDAVVAKHSTMVRDQIALEEQLKQARIAATSSDKAALEAVAELERKIAETHTVLEQEKHDATMAGYQSDMLAAKDSADRKVVIEKQKLAETLQYEGGNAKAVAAARHQVEVAEQAASEQRMKLELAALDQKAAAAKNSIGTLIAIENQKLAVLRHYGKEGTLEYQHQITRRIALEHQGGDEAIKLQVAKLRGDQEAAQGDYAAQLAIQDKIVVMVRGHYGAETAELQAELNKQQRLRTEAARQDAQIALQRLEEQRHLLDEEARAQLRHIDAARQEDEMTIGEARRAQVQIVETYQAAANRILAIEAQKAHGIRALSEQVARRQQELAQQSATTIQHINDRAAEETHRAWVSSTRQVASTFASEATSILTGQRTFAQAIQGLGAQGVQAAIGWGGRRVLAWAASELQQTAITQTNAALRAGADGAASAPKWAVVLASWLGLETGKTGASVAGAAARETADGAEVVAGKAASTANALFQIKAAAAIAAANTFASISAIPVVGPELAPAAAAAAAAEVMAFAAPVALAVGAWQLPGDTLAQLHKGEMVVPQTFADGLRTFIAGGSGGGGGSGGDQHFHFPISTPDAAGVHAFFNAHSATIARVVSRAMGNNTNLRPSY